MDYSHLASNLLIISVEPIVFSASMLESVSGWRVAEVKEMIREESTKGTVYRIEYRSQEHKVIGFIAEPNEGDNLPCIIINRGGSKDFSIWTEERVYKTLIHWASLGYITLTSQYSGCGGSEGKDELGGAEFQDVLVFKELLEHHPRANTKAIGMFGASRGGMMVYRALAEVDWLRAAVSQCGVSNHFRSYELRPSLKEWHSDMYDVNNAEEVKKRSALYWPEKFCKTTPLLLVHGSADNRVSVLDSLELAIKLYENKVPYRLVVYEGADHYISEFKKQEMALIEKWFERYLKNNEPLPNLELHGE